MKGFRYVLALTAIFLTFSAIASKDNSSPIVKAVNKKQCEEVKKLLARGVSPNTIFTEYTSKNDTTIIYTAITMGDICTTNALISSGADLNHIFIRSSYKPIWIRENTPLSIAIGRAYQTKKIEIVEILLKNGARTDLKASDGKTYIQHAINNLKNLGKLDKEREKVVKKVNLLIRKYSDN